MNAIVSESRISLDARLFCKDVIILMFEVAHDLREAEIGVLVSLPGASKNADNVPSFVVDLVPKAWRIHNCERYAGALLVQFQFWSPVSER